MIILNSNDTLIGGRYDRIEVRGKNATIKDAVVEGDGVTLYSNYNCSGLVVEDCTFVSRKNNAVKIIADNISGMAKNIKFKNCEFTGQRMGVELQNHKNEDYKIADVEFEDCKFTSAGFALSLTGYGRNVRCYNCTFDGAKKGVELVGFSHVVLQTCTLTGAQAFIASGDRPMQMVSLRLCKLNGSVRLENCSESCMEWCTVVASPYLEIKKSAQVTLLGCEITSSTHYGVMLNQSSYCTLKNNKITDTGSNYAVVRCYGVNAEKNIVRDNQLFMQYPKKGSWYDQKNGAKDNVFQNNDKIFLGKP